MEPSRPRPPLMSSRALAVFVKRYFSFRAVEDTSFKPLVGYDDRNYKFVGSLKDHVANKLGVPSLQNQFVLKFLNSRDSKDTEVVDGLTELLKFLYERKIHCPYPIPTTTETTDMVVLTHKELVAFASSIESNDGSDPRPSLFADAVDNNRHYCVRVFGYLSGEPIGYTQHSPELLHELGCYIGRMNIKMKKFSHAGLETRQLIDWDLKHLLSRRNYLPAAIKDPVKEKILKGALDDFEKHVIPILESAEYGCIHNDVNLLNVIGSRNDTSSSSLISSISGIIDFSDCVFSLYIFELGIAMTYIMTRSDDPVNYVKPFLQGYLSVLDMSKESLDVLYYVIMGRIAQSCINSAYNYQLEPTNEYILNDAKPMWALMTFLLKHGKEACYQSWDITAT